MPPVASMLCSRPRTGTSTAGERMLRGAPILSACCLPAPAPSAAGGVARSAPKELVAEAGGGQGDIVAGEVVLAPRRLVNVQDGQVHHVVVVGGGVGAVARHARFVVLLDKDRQHLIRVQQVDEGLERRDIDADAVRMGQCRGCQRQSSGGRGRARARWYGRTTCLRKLGVCQRNARTDAGAEGVHLWKQSTHPWADASLVAQSQRCVADHWPGWKLLAKLQITGWCGGGGVWGGGGGGCGGGGWGGGGGVMLSLVAAGSRNC